VALAGLPIVAAPQSLFVRDEARQVGLLTGLKVCLVEDDRNVLLATSALLERWGCVVQAEWSAEDLHTDCDIIVADYDLGTHATGIECIDEMRRRRGWAVPAMIITGHDIEKIQAALHDRQIAILSKPVRPAELRATLRGLRDRQL
jgi:CheY-like chemotaxis protein